MEVLILDLWQIDCLRRTRGQDTPAVGRDNLAPVSIPPLNHKRAVRLGHQKSMGPQDRSSEVENNRGSRFCLPAGIR